MRILFSILAVLYPVLVFAFLFVFHLPVRVLSLCVIALAFAFFFGMSYTGRNRKISFSIKPFFSSLILIVAGLACFFTKKVLFLKLYSVIINFVFLFIFAFSLFTPQNIIFRFATLMDKSILNSSFEHQVQSYCRKVTYVWCVYFILNGFVSFYTVFCAGDGIWALYNGCISYVVTGLVFAIEYIIRRKVDKNMIKAFPITKFKNDSRKDDFIICYEDYWSAKKYKTWLDFLKSTKAMRKFIMSKNEDDWILHCEDYWYFLITFVALLQCGKRVYLTQNIAPSFMNEIMKPGFAFLTDKDSVKSYFIPSIAENIACLSEKDYREDVEIDSLKTEIFMYTSGSTGKPKAVPQRMKEFEEDNAFIMSKWGKEIKSRKLVSTVSQHHIYGFLFGISLPFAIGTPFRRKRIEFPEEFGIFSDDSYIVITTPAFLKRSVDVLDEVPIHTPWIFTSGGAVSPELAVSVKKVFGFYPLEVYGSTETSGIAYRQQNRNNLAWTPFDNAKVWKGDDGCLRIISPYIKNPEGFATADLVEFIDGGKHFLLKGRADSIVKIEEKRISLTEIENRLMETKLISEVKVVALSNDVRQYLAAAIVFNSEGKIKFQNMEKFLVNKYFHDFLMQYFENVVIPKKWRFIEKMPCDIQGKIHKNDIVAMFAE